MVNKENIVLGYYYQTPTDQEGQQRRQRDASQQKKSCFFRIFETIYEEGKRMIARIWSDKYRQQWRRLQQ